MHQHEVTIIAAKSLLLLVDPLIRAALGAALLSIIVVGKWWDIRFRARSIAVNGRVHRKIRKKRHLSYYVAYEYQGLVRLAEYCEAALQGSFEEGDAIRILIDPKQPPDSTIPEEPFTPSDSNTCNCDVAGTRLFSFWDYINTGAALAVMLEGIISHF